MAFTSSIVHSLFYFLGLGFFTLFFFLVFTPALFMNGFFKIQNKNYGLLVCSINTCLLPTLLFWSFYLSNWIGQAFSWILLYLVFKAWRNPKTRAEMLSVVTEKEFFIPLFLIFFVGLFYISGLLIFEPQAIFHRFGLPGSEDNLIQNMLARLMVKGISPFNQILDHYPTTIADRPPLIAAFFLMNPILLKLNGNIHFVVQTLIPSLFWIPTLWAFLEVLNVEIKKKIFLILFLSLHGFFFFYSIFTWGKMLAGALALASILFLILIPEKEKRKPTYQDVIIASLGVGFAGFSHGGSLFFILPVVIYFLWPANWLGLKKVALGVVVSSVILLPWPLLKAKYEPTSPGLMRFALANSEDPKIFNPQIGLTEAIRKSYSGLSAEKIVAEKLNNIKDLNDFPLGYSFFIRTHFPEGFSQFFFNQKMLDIYNVIRSLGFLQVFLPLFIFLVFFARPKTDFSKMEKKALRKISVICLTSVAIWTLVVYKVYGIAHGSNANQLLLFLIPGWTLLKMPEICQKFFYYAQLLYFLAVWIFFRPEGLNQFNVFSFLVFLVIFLFYAIYPFAAFPSKECKQTK